MYKLGSWLQGRSAPDRGNFFPSKIQNPQMAKFLRQSFPSKREQKYKPPQIVSSHTTVPSEIFHKSSVVGVAFNTFIVCQFDGKLYFVSLLVSSMVYIVYALLNYLVLTP